MIATRVQKVVHILRDHKKKSVAAVAVAFLGFGLLREREKNRCLFADFCKEALKYGQVPAAVLEAPKRVLVLLNDQAKDGKARANFERYALPLLHLAGYDVNVIRPKDVDELQTIASAIDRQEADVVYVVGGGGTFAKVCAAMMRPDDHGNVSLDIVRQRLPPLALFPGGYYNYSIRSFIPWSSSSIKWCCESAMAIIRGKLQDLNVMKVKINEQLLTAALHHVYSGPFLEAEERRRKWWFFGSVKERLACLRSTMTKDIRSSRKLKLTYVEPCEGCSNCYSAPGVSRGGGHWWDIFTRPLRAQPKRTAPDYSKRSNPDCGVKKEMEIMTSELTILNDETSKHAVANVYLGPQKSSRFAWLFEGWERYDNGLIFLPSDTFNSQAKFQCRELSISLDKEDKKEDETGILSVDGERETFSLLHVEVLPRVFQCFSA